MHLVESWTVSKAPAISEKGIVVAQNARAAAAGAELLAAGGNAVDAAVATAFALGVVEPWMSGIGGAGYLVFAPANGPVEIVDFSLVAARRLDPARYPLSGGIGPSFFRWPAVEGDRNLKGFESVCVPGSVDGLGLALDRFGRKSLAEAMAPAIRLVEAGLPLDWHTSLGLAVAAKDLSEFDGSRAQWLPGGLPPVADENGQGSLKLPALAATYRRIAQAGRRDFYEGELARALVADLRRGGSAISDEDLASYKARIVRPIEAEHRGVRLHVAPELTGGPTYLAIMAELARLPAARGGAPGTEFYLAFAAASRRAFEERLATMGEGGPSNTTHLSVVDREGNMVALTNTLLARFGSKVTLPQTGIVMNNGMMWFDPVPGRPNSIAPGRRPLANMCPLAITKDGKPWVALGACGGRRIIPAVAQLTAFLVDYGMDLSQAFATPRIDSSTETLLLDHRLPREVLAALEQRFAVEVVEDQVYPSRFAIPSAVRREGGRNTGMTHIRSPAAAAVAEPG